MLDVSKVILWDVYGALLTEKQREVFDLRYNQDLSLFEIAQQLGVSRQAVRDSLNRGFAALREYEEKIGAVRLYSELTARAKAAKEAVEAKDLEKAAAEIDGIIKALEEDDGV